MFRKSLLLLLAVSLLHVCVNPALAGSQRDEPRIAEVKAQVAKRGVGEKARIKVELRDKKEVKGFVSQAGEEDIVVSDAKTGTKTTVSYRDVAEVKGKGFPLAAKIGIGVRSRRGRIGFSRCSWIQQHRLLMMPVDSAIRNIQRPGDGW